MAAPTEWAFAEGLRGCKLGFPHRARRGEELTPFLALPQTETRTRRAKSRPGAVCVTKQLILSL